MSRRQILLSAVAGGIVLAFAPCAQAHLVTTGLGPVYDGIGHFFLSPDDILATLAIVMLAGLRGPAAGRSALVALPLGWILGGVGALIFAPNSTLSGAVPAALSLLVLGPLVAADRPLSSRVIGGIALVMGVVHGFLNGLAMGEAGLFPGLLQLIGVAVTLAVLTSLLAALIISLRHPTARIIIRVGGSWIGAIGLLLLGWAFRIKR